MGTKPKLIHDWNELKECVSETHFLEIDDRFCSGWIRSKKNDEDEYYLSTHTFYGLNYKGSTELLQKCGFNVELVSWDE